MSRRLEASMVQEALPRALGRRKPSAGLMPHSDRGRQYACHAYQRLLGTPGIGCRMRRQGACLDNAVAERFFGSLTRERTAHRYDATRQDARAEVIDDLEMCYNSRRKHSSLGYVSPNDDEAFALVA
jgi:putative transposase